MLFFRFDKNVTTWATLSPPPVTTASHTLFQLMHLFIQFCVKPSNFAKITLSNFKLTQLILNLLLFSHNSPHHLNNHHLQMRGSFQVFSKWLYDQTPSDQERMRTKLHSHSHHSNHRFLSPIPVIFHFHMHLASRFKHYQQHNCQKYSWFFWRLWWLNYKYEAQSI